MLDAKKKQLREQIGVVLLALVLVGSGVLLLKQKDTPATFTAGTPAAATDPTTNANAKTEQAAAQPTSATKAAPVNINKAGLEELDTLPGVGPATAQKILDYRTQNGDFTTTDGIMDVSGIGPSKYAQMKDLISI